MTPLILIAMGLGVASAGFNPPRARDTAYNGALGSQCEYDDDCLTRHAYCRSNRICDCRRKYQFDSGTESCYPTELGLRCSEDYDCVGMDNARCDENGLCQCKVGYVAHEGASSCLPSSRLQAQCTTDSQCIAADQFSRCDTSTKLCSCNEDYHADIATQQCTKNKRLRDTCSTHQSCASSQSQVDAVQCRPDTDGRNKCLCSPGFSEQNNLCAKGVGDGAAAAVASLAAITFTLLLTLLAQ